MHPGQLTGASGGDRRGVGCMYCDVKVLNDMSGGRGSVGKTEEVMEREKVTGVAASRAYLEGGALEWTCPPWAPKASCRLGRGTRWVEGAGGPFDPQGRR